MIYRKMNDIEKAYDLMSKSWDNKKNGAQATEHKPFLKMIGKVKDLKILDAGCGTGDYSVILAKKGAKVTGIDFSNGMISKAKINAKNNGINIVFKKADICSIPFKDNTFDKVISCRVLNFVKKEKLNPALKELIRVLKNGGELVLSLLYPGLGKRTNLKVGEVIYQIPKYEHSVEDYEKKILGNNAKIVEKRILKILKSFKKFNPEYYERFKGKNFILLFKIKKR